MATEIIVRKIDNVFVPVDMVNIDFMEELESNVEYKIAPTRPRNLAFHKKAFALLKVVYDAWDVPDREHKGVKVRKNLESLREDMTILAGYYTVEFKYDGSLRLKAKSWSFASMDDVEFSKLYSALIDVALTKILTNYTLDDLNEQVDRVLGFA